MKTVLLSFRRVELLCLIIPKILWWGGHTLKRRNLPEILTAVYCI